MSSDYFIVPTSPDFFCAQAIKSLTNIVPRWNLEIALFRNKEIVYPFPSIPPKFIGFISQKYRPRSGAPAKSFQKWIDIIKNEVVLSLIPALSPIGMAVDELSFKTNIKADEPFNLANIADFNSLIAQSQKHNVPIFARTDAQIEQGGIILENMKESRDNSQKEFRPTCRRNSQTNGSDLTIPSRHKNIGQNDTVCPVADSAFPPLCLKLG